MYTKRQRPRAVTLPAAFIAALTHVGTAEATVLSKAECVAANERGQELRREGKLQPAIHELERCTTGSCPKPVEEDCTERLVEARDALPTVVFGATNAQGGPIPAKVVAIDGAAVDTVLDGVPIVLDPGEHTFEIVADAHARATRRLLMLERARLREVVVLSPRGDSSASASSAPPVRTGFQGAARVGATFPAGTPSRWWPIQPASVLVALGMRFERRHYAGAFGGVAVGSATLGRCPGTCASTTTRFGVEVRHHGMPDATLDPWFGYGTGVAFGSLESANAIDATTTGFEVVRLATGMNWRANEVIGVGPVVDFALELPVSSAGTIVQAPEFHDDNVVRIWLALGLQVVFFP